MQAEHPGFKLLPIASACINPLHIVVERFGLNDGEGELPRLEGKFSFEEKHFSVTAKKILRGRSIIRRQLNGYQLLPTTRQQDERLCRETHHHLLPHSGQR